MWTKKKKIYFILYSLTAKWLPESRHSSFFKKTRQFWTKYIISSMGCNVNVEKGAHFTPELSIGNNSGIGIKCELYGKITIGNDVLMGPEVIIYTQNHCTRDKNKSIISQGYDDMKPVSIGNDVWIGRRVMIMPGCKIGNGCVIAAGAVVTKNMPDYTIVGGVPARVLKKRGS